MQDKVIAVTGAFGILGSAVIAELAERGARPVAVDIADRAAAAGAALTVPGADISTAEGAADVVARIQTELGRLDGLANVAGGFRWEKILGSDQSSWEGLFRMNLLTALEMSRAAAPLLIESRGAIVNIGAAGAVKAGMGMGAYAASKAGVARLTEALAEELKEKHVRVNAVLPSIIDTPGNRNDMPGEDPSRWVAPASLARVIAFLLSEEAEAITGALLPVTGRT